MKKVLLHAAIVTLSTAIGLTILISLVAVFEPAVFEIWISSIRF